MSKLFSRNLMLHYSETNYVVTHQLGPAVCICTTYYCSVFRENLMVCDATEIQYINSLFFPAAISCPTNVKYQQKRPLKVLTKSNKMSLNPDTAIISGRSYFPHLPTMMSVFTRLVMCERSRSVCWCRWCRRCRWGRALDSRCSPQSAGSHNPDPANIHKMPTLTQIYCRFILNSQQKQY